MGKLDEMKEEIFDLNDMVASLEDAINAREDRDTQIEVDLRAANEALRVEIARLIALGGTGVTDADLQGVIDGMRAVGESIVAAANDVASVEDDTVEES